VRRLAVPSSRSRAVGAAVGASAVTSCPMISIRNAVLSASLVSVVALAGCGNKAVSATGFIPGNVRMKEDGDLARAWTAKGFEPARYGKVVVEPVVTPQPGPYGDLTDEQLENCRRIFAEQLTAAFAAVPGNGDRVLHVRAAITEIKPNKPLLNVAPQTQLLKRGYGYAACEIFATDGPGGAPVAAYMCTADTARIGTEKLSATGTAEHAAGDWAKAFRALFNSR